jgi:hypothetical protein
VQSVLNQQAVRFVHSRLCRDPSSRLFNTKLSISIWVTKLIGRVSPRISWLKYFSCSFSFIWCVFCYRSPFCPLLFFYFYFYSFQNPLFFFGCFFQSYLIRFLFLLFCCSTFFLFSVFYKLLVLSFLSAFAKWLKATITFIIFVKKPPSDLTEYGEVKRRQNK